MTELHELHEAHRARLARFGAGETVDMHCHCLPGIDDGPPTMAEAIALCRAVVADGTTTVVATPHQLGAYAQNGGAAIRSAVAKLQAALDADRIPLRVLAGAEVRIDE